MALRDLVLGLPDDYKPAPVTHRFLPGESVGVVGGNASGKSLLLKTILGLVRPRAGRVRVETADIYEDPPRAVQAALFRIGFVWPDGGLMGATNVYDNVALQLRYFGHHDEATIEERVMDWLRRLDLLDVASARPAALTVHQLRRVALARALVHDPTVLLLDEPFSQLDGDSSVRMLDVLGEWKVQGDRTLIIATVGSARVRHLVDRMLYMERGELLSMRPGADALLDTQQAKAMRSRVAVEQADRPRPISGSSDVDLLTPDPATRARSRRPGDPAGPRPSARTAILEDEAEDLLETVIDPSPPKAHRPTTASIKATMQSGDGELLWGDLLDKSTPPPEPPGAETDDDIQLESDDDNPAR